MITDGSAKAATIARPHLRQVALLAAPHALVLFAIERAQDLSAVPAGSKEHAACAEWLIGQRLEPLLMKGR